MLMCKRSCLDLVIKYSQTSAPVFTIDKPVLEKLKSWHGSVMRGSSWGLTVLGFIEMCVGQAVT